VLKIGKKLLKEKMYKYFIGTFIFLKGCGLTLEERFDGKFDKKNHCKCEEKDINNHVGRTPNESEVNE
jgi:hypothetical protein